MKDIPEKIQKHFEFLFQMGFKISDPISRGGLGNWILYIQSNKFNIKVLQDKNEIYLSLAAPRKSNKKISELQFVSLDSVIGYFSKDLTYQNLKNNSGDIDAQMLKLANVLKSNYNNICLFFEKKKYTLIKEEFEVFLEARRKHFLSPYGYKSKKK